MGEQENKREKQIERHLAMSVSAWRHVKSEAATATARLMMRTTGEGRSTNCDDVWCGVVPVGMQGWVKVTHVAMHCMMVMVVVILTVVMKLQWWLRLWKWQW